MRMEHDTMGEIAVPAERHWGAQTQRSLENFPIGTEKMPREILEAFFDLKEACARANADCGRLTAEQAEAIAAVCDESAAGEAPGGVPPGGVADRQRHPEQHERQRGHRPPGGGARGGAAPQRPRQPAPSPPTTPSPRRCTWPPPWRWSGGCCRPASVWRRPLRRLEEENRDVIRIGRTHLQDATPLRFSQEISGWRELVAAPRRMLEAALPELRKLAIGGTAVGTGLNAPADFDQRVCGAISAGAPAPTSPRTPTSSTPSPARTPWSLPTGR